MTEESNEIRDDQVSTTEEARVATPWWRRPAALIAAGALALTAVVGGGVAHAHKTVTIDVDGTTHTVSTFAGSVAGVLDREEIEVGEHDLVAPNPQAALKDGATIVVRTAEPIEVEVDGETITVWTTADDMAAALEELRDSGRDASIIAASRAADREQLNLPLVVNGAIRVNDGGEIITVEMTGAATLQQVLDQADIQINDTDKITITTDKKGAIVVIDRIVVKDTTETKTLDFTTVEEKTADLYVGQSRVKQAGKAGKLTQKIRITTTNGKETGRKVIDEQRSEPVNKIVLVGTKKRPAATGHRGGDASAPAPVVSGDVWGRLAQCESG
ncbi:MAG: ubiquitin-like domain-containing protein, partial [Bowdeniella nasicola]|nr:ubiquitin-like domain-containing protein [Bowdeniella nasicola]